MVTVWLPFRARRVRPRGVVTRLLWLGALLVAVFAAHGLGPEGGVGHAGQVQAVSGVHQGSVEPTHHEGQQGQGDAADHPAAECLSGKPEDGPSTDTATPLPVAPATTGDEPGPFPAAPPTARRAPGTPHQVANLRV
ncbi:DUF6153 family protein [Kitasatospora sp. NPDC059462]|uniref:DUF6153 family protein n=1 Tax=Kitasatospora sp. NPDC059462 TaxID=3346841 RepID=UPI00368CFD1F